MVFEPLIHIGPDFLKNKKRIQNLEDCMTVLLTTIQIA